MRRRGRTSAARCRGFAADYRTLLVDQPGFGGSDKPPVVGNYYRFSADAVVALLDELGLDKVHLLGNSLGGGTAMRLALSYPDRVGRLIMMGPGGLSLNLFHADPTEGVQRLMDFGADPTREKLRAFISTMVVNQALVTDELVEERFADATAPGAQDAMRSMGMSFWNPETAEDGMLWREAHQLRQHTLLTWGREDRVNPLDGAMVALKLIPKAQLHVFPRCGHWAQIEAADEFREVALQFLNRHVERTEEVTIDIKSMGYVRVASTDLDAWKTFAGKVLGLAEGRGPNADHQYWRIDEVSARIVVFPSDVDELACSGWEVADHQALQAAREHLQKAGVEFEEGTKEELDDRRVQELVRFRDPWDNVFELFHGITYESRPVVTPYAAKFVTADQGMGHLVVPVLDDVEALRFYTEVLGFRLRDSMSMPGEFVGKEPGSKVWLRFLGVNPRHHSLAFLPMPNPSKCVHIMLEVDQLDHVGRALERVRKHGVKLSATLGRHMNDEMISFYVRSPGGFDIEFGTDGLRVEDGKWVARESTAVSYWGHDFGGGN